jgi:hypothetical protein
MTIKEIKKALQTPGTTFKYTTHLGQEKVFKCDNNGKGEVGSISVDMKWYFDSMNVEKFGPTCVWLYTYNMMGTRTLEKIRYENIEIISVGE